MTMPGLPTRFDTRAGFLDALRAGLALARAEGLPMAWVDEDFVDWPLGEAGWVAALTEWVQASTRARLRLFARRHDAVAQRHPRFVGWRQRFDHRLEARVLRAEEDAPLPGLLLCGEVLAVRLLDRERWRGRTVRAQEEPVEMQRLRQQIEAVWQRGEPGFPASHLGL
ncbi:hypothetical protein [Aquabacterium sp. J223]|uniref:hypothetical protein n=1 Tax=Aquabacterium sp. J223 TaxID=2898431 RepID=UPI0021ADB32B|nr:hypothetical protein [Aquabacterium sp. J223]UUX95180.1 hypothetical protein LRS07_18395 [Aquabacterium sp. J223]